MASHEHMKAMHERHHAEKRALHTRHEREMRELTTRHEAEMGGGASDGGGPAGTAAVPGAEE